MFLIIIRTELEKLKTSTLSNKEDIKRALENTLDTILKK